MVRPISEYQNVEDWERDVQKKREQAIEALRALGEAFGESRGVGSAEDGLIRAEMGNSGSYDTLVVGDAAFRFGPTRLASGILAALRAAHNAKLAATRAAAAEQVGGSSVDDVFTPEYYAEPDDDDEPDSRRR